MGVLAGLLGITDLDTRLVSLETRTVTDAVNEVLARYTEVRNEAFAFFVESETTDAKWTYTLPGGAEMELVDEYGTPVEERPVGKWEVAFPLRKAVKGWGYDRDTFAYLTVADLERINASMQIANAKTHKKQMMKALFGNANYTFTDRRHGALTIRRLANGDGSTYPPVMGSDTEADDTHYLETGYTSITDTNNPLKLIKDELKEHWPGPYKVVALINSAQRAAITSLSAFVDARQAGIDPGDDQAVASEVGGRVPGEFLGIVPANGVWVYEWDEGIPANYLFGRDLGRPAPLIRRVHGPEQLRGFKIEGEDESWPLFKRSWVDRDLGYGVGNRLNGAVVELGTGGSYTVPAIYA